MYSYKKATDFRQQLFQNISGTSPLELMIRIIPDATNVQSLPISFSVKLLLNIKIKV